MNTVDDPTLALLSRFVGDTHDLQLSDAEFLLQQVAAIEHYTKQFPAGEYQVSCALIIGERKASTDKKTSLNSALREFNVAV